MSKRELAMRVVRGAREYSIGTVLFHQAAGQLLGVNVTDMKCLDLITMKDRVTASELAAHTGLSTGATTAMIDRLEERGLIERRRHASDRRAVVVTLSRRAARKLPVIFASLANTTTELVASYPKKDLEVLADFFANVAVLWKKEREKLMARRSTRRKPTKRPPRRS